MPGRTMARSGAISRLAGMIAAIDLGHPVRVGIDGVDASGKTTLADELVAPIESRGRQVLRVSVDGFHNPSEVRHRRGRRSPRGYYEDSFNHDAILEHVLHPLGPGGGLKYRAACFDFRTDSPVDAGLQDAPPDSVLLFDGVFLHRPELASHWDFSIFVHADFEVTVQRAQARDQYLFGDPEEVAAIYRERYIPGQRIYLDAVDPAAKASVVLDNNDVEDPELRVR